VYTNIIQLPVIDLKADFHFDSPLHNQYPSMFRPVDPPHHGFSLSILATPAHKRKAVCVCVCVCVT
jgi:hypothetical protein